MIDVKRIVISPDELEKCRVFSTTCAQNQQAIEFGQRTTAERPIEEIARDNLIGKIAEVAFVKMMKENYGLDIPLDFNYYPRGQWDNQDAEINGWRIDIKGTRKGGHWLLVEWNKLCFRQRDNNLSHVYMMFSVEWDRVNDAPTGLVSYEGAASLAKLVPSELHTHVLKQGSVLPGTRAVLQADNYGIQFRHLYKHLNTFVRHILAAPPPASLTNNYKNPYTGETTVQMLRDKQ